MGLVKRGAIDLGTNTCLLLLADLGADFSADLCADVREATPIEDSQILGDYSRIVRLGEGVDQQRNLQPQPMERVLECLRDFADKVKATGLAPQDVICVATSQARDARNSAEFFARIFQEIGFQFRILSGDEEAKYTFQGALLPGMDPSRTAVIDIGGGSTEVSTLTGGRSVDIGAVRLFERFWKGAHGPEKNDAEESAFERCQHEIDLTIVPLINVRKDIEELVGVAGTVTTLAAWHLNLLQFDRHQIDSVRLSRDQVHAMVMELKSMTLQERANVSAIGKNRADVILPGALILWRVMEKLDFSHCRVSTRGLRFGVIGL